MASKSSEKTQHSYGGPQPSLASPIALENPQNTYFTPRTTNQSHVGNAAAFSANAVPRPNDHTHLQPTPAKHDEQGKPLLLFTRATGLDDSPVPSEGASTADEDEMLTLMQLQERGHKPQQLRSPLLKWHHYNVSADSKIHPEEITCELSVTFDGCTEKPHAAMIDDGNQQRSFPNPNNNFVWYKVDNYQSIQQYCDLQRNRLRAKLLERYPRGEFDIYLRYGLCNIIGSNDETRFSPETSRFEDEHDMGEIAIKEVCRFIGTYPHQKFKLVLALDYGYIIISLPDVKFTELIKMQYKQKLASSKTTVSNHSYMSKPDMNRLTTPQITRRIIDESDELGNEADKSALKEKVDKVGAQTIFAICVHKGIRLQTFRHFLDYHGYNDGNVPKKAPANCALNIFCEQEHIDLIKGTHQFFVHTVEEDKWFHERSKGEVVPIYFACDENGKKKDKLGKGAYSKVWEARIDITHQSLVSVSRHASCKQRTNLYQNLSKTYALKIFEDDNTNDADGNLAFRKEIRMLLYLAQYPHHHILSHITSWEQNGKFYILYEKAISNLYTYMEEPSEKTLSKARLLWFFTQLLGLANAVRKVHQLREPIKGEISPYLTPPRVSSPKQAEPGSVLRGGQAPSSKSRGKRRRTGIVGYHHDIKPHNILAFEQPGQLPILKLSDFGAGKFSSVRGKHHSVRPTDNPHGTLTYFGPEYPAGAEMTRPFDMWALGCVYLELLLWFLDLHQPHNGSPSLATMRQKPFEHNRGEVFDYFWQQKTKEEIGEPDKTKVTFLNIQKHAAVATGQHLEPPKKNDLLVADYKLNTAVEEVLRDLRKVHCVGMRAFQHLIEQIRCLLEIRPTKRLNAVTLANRLDAVLSQLEVDLKHDDMHDQDNTYAKLYGYNCQNADARRNNQPLEVPDNTSAKSKKFPTQYARPQNPNDDISLGYARSVSPASDINMFDAFQNDDSQDEVLGHAGSAFSQSPRRGDRSPSGLSQSHFLSTGTDDEDMNTHDKLHSKRRERSPSAEFVTAHRPAKHPRSSQGSSPGRTDDELGPPA